MDSVAWLLKEVRILNKNSGFFNGNGRTERAQAADFAPFCGAKSFGSEQKRGGAHPDGAPMSGARKMTPRLFAEGSRTATG
jgi:hypothetical protein